MKVAITQLQRRKIDINKIKHLLIGVPGCSIAKTGVNLKARSSVVEHCFDVARVSGSIPLAPTILRSNELRMARPSF